MEAAAAAVATTSSSRSTSRRALSRTPGWSWMATGPRVAPIPSSWSGCEAGKAASVLLRKLEAQDFDDTVLAAELEAARALVSRLDPGRFRVSVLTFAEEARLLSPPGFGTQPVGGQSPGSAQGPAPRSRRDQLSSGHRDGQPRAAVSPLGKPDDRLRSIVFLSDGAPTRPVHGDRAERYALEAAIEAGRSGDSSLCVCHRTGGGGRSLGSRTHGGMDFRPAGASLQTWLDRESTSRTRSRGLG